MHALPVMQNRRATRSSLACLPCRSRHVKCDGKRPCCGRCAEVRNQCSYAQSRRGGLDRAALTERRKRMASAVYNEPVNQSSLQQATAVNPEGDTTPLLPEDVRHEPDVIDIDQGDGNTDSVSRERVVRPGNIANDSLIDSYYKNFHICHPFVLPRNHLTKLYQDPRRQDNLAPLVATLRLIGNIYKAREWSIPLRDSVQASISMLSPSDPILVQCRILYSVALFWYDHKADAKSQMDQAARLAIDLQMFRAEFAASQGLDHPVLRESWRRTWWMLYIFDAYYAGTLGTMNLWVMDIDVTVELPCDEADYQSGDIPTPRTLQEFDHREFIHDNVHFSSFAYLIGAVQCAATAISTTPKIAAVEDPTRLIQAVDCSLDGWRLLLPPEHANVMNKDGEIDELMFQAQLLIQVSTIGLHRPLSDVKFNAIENVSSCAREPPLDTPRPDMVNVHTTRVLQAVEAQIRLLALPVRWFHHTPFTTCMVSEGTLALLSACSSLLKGKDLKVARDQIRMTLGCLKVLGEVWPRTARNVREIQTIAQCVLGLGQVAIDQSTPGSSELPTFAADGITLDSSNGGLSTGDNDLSASLAAIEDLCGWYGLEGLDNLQWEMGTGL